MLFKSAQSDEQLHAVFPKGVNPPQDLADGAFHLKGHFQQIQNRQGFPLKQPTQDYRYFVVSWKASKK